MPGQHMIHTGHGDPAAEGNLLNVPENGPIPFGRQRMPESLAHPVCHIGLIRRHSLILGGETNIKMHPGVPVCWLSAHITFVLA